jgi:hypothetical protein
MNYDLDIEFANIRQAKVLKLKDLRTKAIECFRNRYADDADNIALGFALKLSISGSNLDRVVPMTIEGHTVSSESFISCVKPQRGQDVPEDALTVSRFCAALANDISIYLEKHPDKVRTTVSGVPAKLSFPHCYYVSGLNQEEKNACIAWLQNHDHIMEGVTSGRWRPLSLKAVAFFAAQ